MFSLDLGSGKEYNGSMEPFNEGSRVTDTRITITIHNISLESQMRFKGLCVALNKPQYEVFNEIVDFYWKNLNLNIPKRRQAVIARKLIDTIHTVAKGKNT